MSKVKIITDSTSYITKEYAMKENVTIVPLNYIFGEDSKKEGFPGEFDEFFEKLRSTKLFPTTSQPSAGEFVTSFTEAFEEGYDEIIAILLSSKLSGTCNSALLAKGLLENKSITIIDSVNTASNLRFLVEDAVEMVKEGKNSQEIEDYLNQKKTNMYIYLTTGTLEYLCRGGRLSTIQSTVGNLLNIKPILQLKDGELKLLEKLRGKNNAIKSMTDKIIPSVEKISICHVFNEKEAIKLKGNLEEKFPNTIVTVDILGPVIGSHLGDDGIGVCFY